MNQQLVIQQHNVSDIERIARGIAASRLFGVQNPEQALALCLVAQAEGRHPASAAGDYHIIQGRPAKKADAMLRDFLASGGKVKWHALTDEIADATFSHPAGGDARITWDMEQALRAELFFMRNGKRMRNGKNGPEVCMWEKYPRQMLRARVVSEGVRTVFPMATSGMYVPEEVSEFTPATEPKDVTPADAPMIEQTDEKRSKYKSRQIDGEMRQEIDACQSIEELQGLWKSKPFQTELAKHPDEWRDLIVEYFNERIEDMRQNPPQPVKGYAPPSFDRLEAPTDSLTKAQLKASVAMESAAVALTAATSAEGVKAAWDDNVEGRFEGEAMSRLTDVYEAALRQFGVVQP